MTASFYSETGFIGFNNLIKNKNNERISDIFSNNIQIIIFMI